MRKQFQMYHGEEGDCMRACIATILEIPITIVPNFSEGVAGNADLFIERIHRWLATRGMGYTRVDVPPEMLFEYNPMCGLGEGPCIVGGRSNISPTMMHVVVCNNGLVVHDPALRGQEMPMALQDVLTPFTENGGKPMYQVGRIVVTEPRAMVWFLQGAIT